MDRIFVTGDTHGGELNGFSKFSTKHFKEQKELTKEKDVVIILGDFGLLWDNVPSKNELYWKDFLEKKNWITVAVDGNHENHARINELPEVPMFGGIVRKYSDSIYFFKRGSTYNICGKVFFTFGGARSIDKQLRKENISWWPEEEPNYSQMSIGLSNLSEIGNKVDYILTHEAPYSDLIKYAYEEYSLTKYLEEIRNLVKFDHWYYGHYHLDEEMSENTTCIFNKIIELDT